VNIIFIIQRTFSLLYFQECGTCSYKKEEEEKKEILFVLQTKFKNNVLFGFDFTSFSPQKVVYNVKRPFLLFRFIMQRHL